MFKKMHCVNEMFVQCCILECMSEPKLMLMNEIIQSFGSVFNIQRYPVARSKTYLLPNGLFSASVIVDLNINNSRTIKSGMLCPFKRTFIGDSRASKAESEQSAAEKVLDYLRQHPLQINDERISDDEATIRQPIIKRSRR